MIRSTTVALSCIVLLGGLTGACGPGARPADLVQLDRQVLKAQQGDTQKRALKLVEQAYAWLKRANQAHKDGKPDARDIATLNGNTYLKAARLTAEAMGYRDAAEREREEIGRLKKQLSAVRTDLHRLSRSVERMRRIEGTDLIGRLARQLREVELSGVAPDEQATLAQGKGLLKSAKDSDSNKKRVEAIEAAKKGLQVIAPLYVKAQAQRGEVLARGKMNLLAKKLQETFSGGASVKITLRGVVVTLLEMFDRGKTELNMNGHQYGGIVARIVNQYKEFYVLVEGHTDSYGSDSANLALSQGRAQSFHDLLQREGVSGARLKAAGLGEARPVAPNTSPDGRAKNRRIEIIFYLP